MILAIFGGSACGKSTLADIVSTDLGIPVRHCGEEIRNTAKTAGYDLSSAPDDLHRKVDRETREWCAKLHSDGVVEGRFLDRVLADMPDIAMVELATSEEERARRLSERLGRTVCEREIRQIDTDSDLFRSRMYRDASPTSGRHQIDTDGSTAQECGQKLILLIQRLGAAKRG